MIPGINPRQAKQMMKRMGMKQEEIDATQVIIKTADKELVISNPSVSRINMMGQETFQVAGDIEERAISSEPDINEDDIKTVMEQTGVDEEKARAAISKAEGDLARAIMDLKQ